MKINLFKTVCYISIFLLNGLELNAQMFNVKINNNLHTENFDGRLLLLFSNNNAAEPRFQISDALSTQIILGKNVDQWAIGSTQSIAQEAYGFPKERLSDIPAGDYYVQVLLHKYETFHLKNGKVVKLPMDRGEGQHWNLAPGNIYSKPIKIHFDPKNTEVVQLTIDQIIPPIIEPTDSKYIKHIKIQSKLLTEFWGRPMYLGAHILLPEGFDTHPNVKYPLAIYHGHFPSDISGFSTTPPNPNLIPDTSARFNITGYNKIQEEEAYQFYKQWTGPSFPRVLAIEIQHATPYYDDSYAVNSANMGPYGDAITYELIPEIEKQFRGLDKVGQDLLMVDQ